MRSATKICLETAVLSCIQFNDHDRIHEYVGLIGTVGDSTYGQRMPPPTQTKCIKVYLSTPDQTHQRPLKQTYEKSGIIGYSWFANAETNDRQNRRWSTEDVHRITWESFHR